jgi:hypothetical protein
MKPLSYPIIATAQPGPLACQGKYHGDGPNCRGWLANLGITGAMRTAPTAASEVVLGLLPLNLQLEAEASAESIDSTAVNNGNPSLKDMDIQIGHK